MASDLYFFIHRVMSMNIRKSIEKFGVFKSVCAVLLVLVIVLVIFNKQIMDSKYTKAKIEMLNRMMFEEPENWPKEIRRVYDSLILEKKDTITSRLEDQ